MKYFLYGAFKESLAGRNGFGQEFKFDAYQRGIAVSLHSCQLVKGTSMPTKFCESIDDINKAFSEEFLKLSEEDTDKDGQFHNFGVIRGGH